MLSDLINPKKCRDCRNCQRRKTSGTDEKALKNGVSGESATATVATVATDEMPGRTELIAICRRAVSDYPGVDSGRLRRFLEVAEDPAWCSERVARHIARRMADGLIREGD